MSANHWAQGYFMIDDWTINERIWSNFLLKDHEDGVVHPIYECEKCGALVRTPRRHVDWHKHQDAQFQPIGGAIG